MPCLQRRSKSPRNAKKLSSGCPGLAVADAVAAPRFSATSDAIDISNRIPRGVQKALEAKGYEVKRSPLSYPFAAPHGITCWDGVLEGGADPQRDGYVAGMA